MATDGVALNPLLGATAQLGLVCRSAGPGSDFMRLADLNSSLTATATHKLRSANGSCHRMGLVLQARLRLGIFAGGSVAGFSEETFEEARNEGLLKNDAISNVNDGLDALGKDLDALGLMPSIRHGVEELWLDRLGHEAGLSLAKVLNPKRVAESRRHLAADAESSLRRSARL